MILTTAKQFMLIQAYPQKHEYMVCEWDKMAAEVRGLLEKHGVLDMPCGADMSNINMLQSCQKAGIRLVDGNHVMAAARAIKTVDEIECLKTAGAITESAHWEVCKSLRLAYRSMRLPTELAPEDRGG